VQTVLIGDFDQPLNFLEAAWEYDRTYAVVMLERRRGVLTKNSRLCEQILGTNDLAQSD
jgi:hypothetical protein